MISGLLASRAGFLDSGNLPETYRKPIKSMPESTISGLVASRPGFLDSGTLSETYQKLMKSTQSFMISGLVALPPGLDGLILKVWRWEDRWRERERGDSGEK